jgi:large subunit ribosomal protein L14e
MFETGRICMKTAGRESGRYCVVVAKDKDKDFLVVTGPKSATHVRRRKCNFRHLEPTPFSIDIKDNATDEEILTAYEKDDIFAKLRIKMPSPEGAKASEERKEKRAEAKAGKEEKKAEEPEREGKKEAHEKKKEEKEHKPAHKEEKPKKARTKKAAKEK